MKQTSYRNELMSVGYNPAGGMREHISFNDLTDHYNDTKGFTRNIRGIKKAWAFIEQIMNDERLKDSVTFYDIVKYCDKFNLNTHTYCGMD